MRYAIFGVVFIALNAAIYWLILSGPEAALTPATAGQLIGVGMVYLTIGCLGLLYKRARFGGFAGMTMGVAALGWIGALR